ncbi:hypothetical protein [Deinococcus maricopensis]|uniref:Uncharacterized protein n=1 Tax=Deinococcus maricopensis (strain DSM 21211 / LMG 22137 / NRRL B-23946 / LB-34) TaxID=709986 RepID=E8U5S7_DEIML|nr:hypothetical protein [Deinococcus maricopensis]ADV66416.1 hypothetical protein Deima_0760 [Deinococcus maricopensis DSM 21211]
MLTPAQLAFAAALLFFTLNYLLGLTLQLRLVRVHVRPLHHTLYFLACAATLMAAALAALTRTPWWPPALLLAGMLLVPRTRPGRADHAALATLLAVGYALAARDAFTTP